MMRNKFGLLSLLLVVGMIGSGILVASSLPPGVELPLHWNASGLPDRMGGKWEALLSPGVVTAVIGLIFYFLPNLEPREQNLERSRGLYMMSWLGMLVVMATTHVVIVGAALHWGLPMLALVQGAIGLLFVLIGNQLGKSRRMYLVGIRTPWTLASEEVWIATHRLAGKLMVGGGALVVLAAFLPLPSGPRGALLMAVAAVSLLLPALYSYLLWRRERVVKRRV
jgi:uncharacterized membrane protein